VLDEEGREWTAPVLTSEAGLYEDETGFYGYEKVPEQSTEVHNLSTNEREVYQLEPADAVRAAFRFHNRGVRTPHLTWGGKTVACGDYCAMQQE
jgi:hypothetical protein